MLIPIVKSSDIADNLAKCVEVDPLNTCLRKTLDHDLRTKMKEGIPELNLPKTEPMKVDSVSFQHGKKPVVMKAKFSDVVVTGLSNFTSDYIEADSLTKIFRIGLTVPDIKINGTYQVDGEVFVFPVEGSGKFYTNMKGVTAVGSSTILPTIKGGRKVLSVNNLNIDFQIQDVKIHMTNLFRGDNELLAKAVNDFLNEHSDKVLNEVRPEIARRMTIFVSRVMNEAFSELPADDLLNKLHNHSRQFPTGTERSRH